LSCIVGDKKLLWGANQRVQYQTARKTQSSQTPID